MEWIGLSLSATLSKIQIVAIDFYVQNFAGLIPI